ncbi:hypothetical protein AI27_00965 [Sphingomonas sp. BHC-A]|nr:hypothetical protein AI27_00965 [Sphingomonas sp. BHC-A]HKY81971.1 ATP-binding protein [Sphingobium sp.]
MSQDQELDLTPAPRVLQMLGEINLEVWRCLAELIDNSIDGFIDAARAGQPIDRPQVSVAIPTTNSESARIQVTDNGPGMSIDTLENALRAGWSGNDALSKLGLFGMGFNIATARMGMVTEVWTTRAGDPEWVGVRIDLNELRSTGNYRVPRQTRPKTDPARHGTDITITRLKPEQRAYLAKANNRSTIRKHLARAYSSLLSTSEVGTIRLEVSNSRINPLRPCVWSAERSVELADGTIVNAVESFDVPLAPRRFCNHCMRTLASDEESCPTGGDSCAVVETPRRLRGWVGLQRYLDKSEFGLDLIRNGRKIEIGNKDLFNWSDGDSVEVEYPIDDPRSRGRFIGEIHLDHCQVSYTKNRFERDDPAWAEMVRVVRGDGPLRPNAARQLGHTDNHSPLYKLFQAFRRSSPQGKNGLWSRVLVVQDNDRAQQMAAEFAKDEVEFLSDERWWQLIEEQDRRILGDGPNAPPPPVPDGFLGDASPPDPPADENPREEAPPSPAPPPPARRPVHELSRRYVHPTFRVEYDIQAFAVEPGDPDLPPGQPWIVRLEDVSTRTYAYLFDATHEIFRSTTMTPLDAMLVELTHRTIEFLRGQSMEATTGAVLADFRSVYSVDTRLDAQEIIGLATNAIADLCRAVSALIPSADAVPIHDELVERDRAAMARRMAGRGVPDPRALIEDGRSWDYADGATVRGLFNRRPELFLDGRYWDEPHQAIDFGDPEITAEARRATVARYDAYLGDVIWLSEQTPAEIERASRDAIIRATCSLRLLRPDVAV